MIRSARREIERNGLVWAGLAGSQRLVSGAARSIEVLLVRWEARRGLVRENSASANISTWGDSYDWSSGGEEWTVSPEWKRSLVEDVLLRYLRVASPAGERPTVLEIGPGAGRWTEVLVQEAGHLYLTDVTETSMRLCKERFQHNDSVSYHVGDGRSLPFLDDETIDYLWSFDVFVHIAPPDIAGYLREIQRTLRPEGVAVVHHAGLGAGSRGWRSSMTASAFEALATDAGLVVERQFDRWGPEGQYDVRDHGDVITVLRCKA